MMGSYYDTMQVCENGHQITAYYDTSPADNQNFCDKCGAETITACKKCGEKIRGHYHVDGFIDCAGTDVPKHCHKCGAPYPWTANSSNKVNSGSSEARLMAGNDLSFIKNTEIGSIIERDYKELRLNYDLGNNKSIIILCGSIMEGFLLDFYIMKKGEKDDYYKYGLDKLIKLSLELEPDELRFLNNLGDTVREFRNLIHPGLEVRRSDIYVDGKEASVSINALNILIRNLRKLYECYEKELLEMEKRRAVTVG